MMLPSRKIIVEFVGVFLIGALVGGLVVWDFTDTELTQFMSRTNDPNSLVDRINKKYTDQYHLSSDELARIQPLVKDMAGHIAETRHRFAVDIISVTDEYHQKIAEQLDPDHKAAYQKAMEDRKKTISSMLLLEPPPSGHN